MKIIGIDPDIDKCGVCEMVNGEIMDLYSIETFTLLQMILGKRFSSFEIAIENVNKINTVYTKKRTNRARVNESIARKIGQVQGAAKIICKTIGFHHDKEVLLAPPGVGKQVKKNAKLFKQITGWQGRTNEDMRDAYAIAVWANNQLTKLK